MPVVSLASMTECAAAASASPNSWPMTGRSRPAAASARAVRASAASSSGLAPPVPARTLTRQALACSGVTGVKLPAGHAERAEPAARA